MWSIAAMQKNCQHFVNKVWNILEDLIKLSVQFFTRSWISDFWWLSFTIFNLNLHITRVKHSSVHSQGTLWNRGRCKGMHPVTVRRNCILHMHSFIFFTPVDTPLQIRARVWSFTCIWVHCRRASRGSDWWREFQINFALFMCCHNDNRVCVAIANVCDIYNIFPGMVVFGPEPGRTPVQSALMEPGRIFLTRHLTLG